MPSVQRCELSLPVGLLLEVALFEESGLGLRYQFADVGPRGEHARHRLANRRAFEVGADRRFDTRVPHFDRDLRAVGEAPAMDLSDGRRRNWFALQPGKKHVRALPQVLT